MKIGITHISDLHLKPNTNFNPKLGKLINLTCAKFTDVETIYLVLSGDIAFSGSKLEYENASKFIKLFKQLIAREKPEICVKPIIVPGNHDCNFDNNTTARDILISNLDYPTIGEDLSVINNGLTVQSEFWKFHQETTNQVHFLVHDKVDKYNIQFECINTAWMSSIDERPGALFFPIETTKELIKTEGPSDKAIRIGVYHHPLNWFTPNTKENNRNELERYFRSNMDIQLLGHEHDSKLDFLKELSDENETYAFSGYAFHQEDKRLKTGFQTLSIDLKTLETLIEKYEWNGDNFLLESTNTLSLKKTDFSEFSLDRKFEEQLNTVTIPLSIQNEVDNLNEIYVFPDLDIVSDNGSEGLDYIDSKEFLLNKDKQMNSIIEGDSQSGKSSLLKALFKGYYKKDFFPLYIQGAQISKSNFEIVLKNSFSHNYNTTKHTLEEYLQLQREKRVLLIDDVHLSKLDSQGIRDFLKYVSMNFHLVIVTVDTAHSLIPSLNSEFLDFNSFSIKPLGYQKKNEIITKYLIKTNGYNHNSEKLFNEARNLFNQVVQIVGDKIIPSYPVFILSILQTLKFKPLDLKETSYGYCYQSLIHFALTGRAKVPNEDIDSYMNFLQELSYDIYHNDGESIDEDSFRKFHDAYSLKYFIKDYKEIKKRLTLSQILMEDDGIYKFGYNYIYYFLVAKHISDIIHTNTGKKELDILFDNISKEKAANILVFITHHTKDLEFIESSLLSVLIPFDGKSPITLEKSGDFYQYIKEISKDITDNVIKLSNTPEEKREKALKKIDEEEFKNGDKDKFNDDEIESSEHIKQFLQAFRALEVVGQIVKNRKGSLEKEKLEELVTEIYSLGFRTVNVVGEILNEAKSEFIAQMLEEIDDNSTQTEIEKWITSYFQIFAMKACLSMFSKLVHAVGIRDLKEVYKIVANKMDSPAADLVSFSINSYYNEVSANEIKLLAEKYRKNPVVFQLLRARTKSYIYNNYVDSRKLQKIASALNFDITPKMVRKPLK